MNSKFGLSLAFFLIICTLLLNLSMYKYNSKKIKDLQDRVDYLESKP